MGYGNGTDRSRTDDLLRVKQALCQLSYDPGRIVSIVYINTVSPSWSIWPSSGQSTVEHSFSIADFFESATTCVYTLSVVQTLAWPINSAVTLSGTARAWHQDENVRRKVNQVARANFKASHAG